MRFSESDSRIEVFVKRAELPTIRKRTNEDFSKHAIRGTDERGRRLMLCHSAHNIFKLGIPAEKGVQYFPPMNQTDVALINLETNAYLDLEKQGRYEATLSSGQRVAIALED